MKIINFNKHRGPRRPYAPPLVTEPTPKRRALLIGINYSGPKQRFVKRLWRDSASTARSGQLQGSHVDVWQMKDLVMKEYHYSPDDIVTLIDDGGDPRFQPTRENILREIDNLVRDAKPGDHFFFHYSGHVEQIRNKDNTEEDGMDECLLPMDAKGKDVDDEKLMIRDNLRAHLVDSLPVGSQLIAVFDSCHSASLLDLDHFRCNRVYVPYVSKGRRKSDSLWNHNVRKNALEQGYDGPLVSTRGVYQTQRVSDSMLKTRKSSIQHCEGRQRVQTRKLSVKAAYEPSMPTPMSPIELCESPVALFPCDGWCTTTPDGAAHEMAQVISLGSCKDGQISWEDCGKSMTTALVQILKENPNPSLKDLMLRVSHELHKSAINVHDGAKKYKKNMKEYRRRGGKQPAVPTDMDNFQDPQLSSHQPLNLEKNIWNP
ncbi:peptidase C14, caspase domain-containing protein [Mucidula mucida]|nr:peptidase C14, caspase domain-containing protein [Mucidula mucida]